MRKDEKVTLDLENLIRGYEKGSKEYLEAKTRFEEIEREFNASFNPEVKIPAKVKEKLCNYGIIDFNSVVIDNQIPKYVENDIWTNGENRILNPLGRLVREIVRQKGDISLVDLLSEREKQIIRDFRTPEGHKATLTDIGYLSQKIEGLCLDQTSDAMLPKAEAAVRYYFTTRRPEELGSVYVDKPDRYKQNIQFNEDNCRRILSDWYNSVPKTKYWWIVWDALDQWYSVILPREELLKEERVLRDLNLLPYRYTFLTSDEVTIPQEYLKLKAEIIAEAKGKRLPVPGLLGIEETIEDVIQRIETTFFYGIRDKDEQIREKLTSGRTFWIALYLRRKHRKEYAYYLKRTKKILKELEKIKDGHESEEFEYLDLKTRLEGDLLFACAFHDYVRGGERYLKIVERRRRKPIKEVVDKIKFDVIEMMRRSEIKGIYRKAILLINALAGEEIYSTQMVEDTEKYRDQYEYLGEEVLRQECLRRKKKRIDQTNVTKSIKSD